MEQDAVIRELQVELMRVTENRDRWAKWGEHVFTCPNKGVNPCEGCISPATWDSFKRIDRGQL